MSCQALPRSTMASGTACATRLPDRGTFMAPSELPIGEAVSPDREDLLLMSERRNGVLQARREAVRLHAAQAALLAVILLGWWAASGRLIDRLFVSDPVSVVLTLVQIALDGTLWWHLWQTLVEMV